MSAAIKCESPGSERARRSRVRRTHGAERPIPAGAPVLPDLHEDAGEALAIESLIVHARQLRDAPIRSDAERTAIALICADADQLEHVRVGGR